jgi:hypothetical protein
MDVKWLKRRRFEQTDDCFITFEEDLLDVVWSGKSELG